MQKTARSYKFIKYFKLQIAIDGVLGFWGFDLLGNDVVSFMQFVEHLYSLFFTNLLIL